MCKVILSICMYVYHDYAWCYGDQKRVLDFLDLELDGCGPLCRWLKFKPGSFGKAALNL